MNRPRAALLLVATVLSGCGGGEEAANHSPTGLLPVGEVDLGPPATADDLVWATGSTLHVGAERYDVGRWIRSFDVGRHGIYYVTLKGLHFTDLEDDELITDLGGSDPVVSPDGRHLGWIDFEQTPAEVVAYDTESGDQVVGDATGMGDPDDDDLGDLYEDSEPWFLGFDGEAAYAVAADQRVRRYPLDGGDATVERTRTYPGYHLPGDAPQGHGEPLAELRPRERPRVLARSLLGGEISPDGRSVLPEIVNHVFEPRSMRTGRRIAIDLGEGRRRFQIGGWLDGHTVYGAAGSPGHRPLGPSATLVVCDLAERSCEDVSGPIRLRRLQTVLFPGRTD